MTKKDSLLTYLQKNPGWHTSQQLALEIGVSKRTIKNYVSQLKDANINILSGSKGYRLKSSLSNDSSDVCARNDIPSTSHERVSYIINYLINNSSSVNSYDLANNLFVSETTIIQDLKNVQRQVERFGVQLKRSGDYWKLEGTEREKRSLLSSLIYKETTGKFMNRSIIQENFPEIDVNHIRNVIVEICNSRNIYLNTFDLNNILLHFVIVIQRLQQGHKMEKNEINEVNKSNKDNLALSVVKQIEDQLNSDFESADRKELALILKASISGGGRSRP